MFVRSLQQIEATDHFVEWGSGTSHRLLTERDGMGFTVCHTVVRAGTVSLLEYRNHLEACYCIAGHGEVEDMQGKVFPINLILVSIFNPPLKGTERHNLNDPSGSAY
ncbi:ectoine synthase [Ensifer adhaerens]|jgi:L-ectoine synthase|uniref:ectoine synthase n=1 Tax=Ensifer adhaerens TaxID=106592 RepID=UPI00202F7075|nr:ectoine synthase [Ensifer adhaerens]